MSVAAVLLNLVAATALRIRDRRWSASWFLVHAGLMVAIASAMMGSMAAVRGKVFLNAGQATAQVVSAKGDRIAYLPFGLMLQEFQLEESAPPLTLVDTSAREIVFRAGEPVFELQAGARGTLRGIEFEVVRYLAHAELDHDTIRAATDTFCPPAALLKYGTGGVWREGWITCGGIGIPTITQPAGSVRLAMAMPPAKNFRSVVTILEMGSKPEEAVIEVNRGLSRDGWTLQQLDYDKAAGRASRISVLEAVRDPFAMWVKVGICLTLAGIVAFAVSEWRRSA
ncbi:MAG: hypothetical protein RL173_2520 [Fibrobacterota bacterium]